MKFPYRFIWALLFLILQSSVFVDGFNFDGYPNCTQPILYSLAPNSCAADTSTLAGLVASNNCLCDSIGFLDDAAVAIRKQCGCTDLTAAAQQVSNNCARTETTSAVTVDDFIQAGTSEDTCDVDHKLDTGSIVGIVTGTVSGLLALALVVIGLLQLAVTAGWSREDRTPLPRARRFLARMCCHARTRSGYLNVDPSMRQWPQDAVPLA